MSLSSLNSSFNFRGNCVLDVIQGENCFFAMDLLSFNSTDYSDSECESRLFTLFSRVSPWFPPLSVVAGAILFSHLQQPKNANPCIFF